MPTPGTSPARPLLDKARGSSYSPPRPGGLAGALPAPLLSRTGAVAAVAGVFLLVRLLNSLAPDSSGTNGAAGGHSAAVAIQTPPTPSVDSIYIYRAHKLDSRTLARFEKLAAEVPEGPQWAFIMLDDTAQQLNGTRVVGQRWAPAHGSSGGGGSRSGSGRDASGAALPPPLEAQTLLVNDSECATASPLHSEQYISGHVGMALVGQYFAGVDYKHIWFIDWDARCHGHAARCFALPANYSGVGMTAYLVGPYDPSGHRFHELAGEINKTAIEARHHSFLPLVRFSKHFLAQVFADMRISGGLLEVYLPTLCAHIGCNYRPMPRDKFGEFTYVWQQDQYRCKLALLENDKWYHPCKGNP